jgi:hypothetical protein
MEKESLTVATIAIVTAAVVLSLTTVGLLTANKTPPANVTVTAVNVGLYADSDCTHHLTSFEAGTVDPGDTATQTFYVKNEGTVPETLSMTVDDWNPASANSSLTLAWNRESLVLDAGQSIQATLTLTVAQSTGSLTNFSCNVTISGTQ